jgi:hypothetical protein
MVVALRCPPWELAKAQIAIKFAFGQSKVCPAIPRSVCIVMINLRYANTLILLFSGLR